MIRRVAKFFADPAHQALAWAALGIVGVALAAAGLYLMTVEEPPRFESLSVPTLAVTPTASPVVESSATVLPATPNP